MFWQPACTAWDARSNAIPRENEVTFLSHRAPAETSPHITLLRKGHLWQSVYGLSVCNRPFLFALYNRQRNGTASLTRAAAVTSKNEDGPVHFTEFFELARKKRVKPFLSTSEDKHSHSANASSDKAALARDFPAEERDLSPGLHDSGRARTLRVWPVQQGKGAHDPRLLLSNLNPRLLLSNLKKVSTDAWGEGQKTLQATPLAPLLPYTTPLSAVIAALFVVGILIGRWIGKTSNKSVQLSNAGDSDVVTSSEAKAPAGISVFLETDMKKKESVEWVNMVFGKLWKVYRLGMEGWLVGLLQPLIDNLQKPDYVQRVQIKRFDLGDEPLSIRSIERRTSRRANDLQYHIGLRYTGGARMILLLTLKAAFIPIAIPVGVRGLDVDGELWVKLRLVPADPWVGTATWAFVSLPKIKLDLSPFRLFNLMAIPFLSIFLTKLLTQDLPRLFVRPNKNVVDFLQGKAVGPVPKDFKGATLEKNKDFSGELSVTLVDAKKLKYAPLGKTDPYVILILGDQVIRSKKNSQTSVIGPPGGPIWNQDFQLLVIDPKTQRLDVRVRDYFGLTAFTLGLGEVDLISLRDTVPVDKVVKLRGAWGPFTKRNAGEVLLRMTYTAYIDDEEEDIKRDAPLVPSRDIASVSGGMTDPLPLVNEVIDKVVETVRVENPKVIEAMSSILNGEGNKDASAGGLESAVENGSTVSTDDVGSREAGIGRRPAEKDKVLVSAQAEDRLDGRTVLLWLGIFTLLSILVAVSLNFSNLMKP